MPYVSACVVVSAVALIRSAPRVVAQQPMFDAASIVSSDHGGRSTYRVTPGGIVYTNATLGDCLLAAYQVSRFEVVGPDWLRARRFDIVARTSGPASKEQLMMMLQTLLAQRFGVRLHREPREMRAFALTARRGGPKLKPGAANGLADILAGPDGAELKNHTLSQVAHYLSRLPIGLPVVDVTGIEGRYDFQLSLGQRGAEKKPSTAADSALSLAAATSTIVSDALQTYGLELQSRTLRVPVIVIDEARPEPTPN
jgi:uncharacterized protein (TIGR03435 family)